jgi:hypothetical protein
MVAVIIIVTGFILRPRVRRPVRHGGNMAVDENCSSTRALESDRKRAKVAPWKKVEPWK